MTTVRQQVFNALYAAVQGVAGPTIVRNEPTPQTIPPAGFIAQREGTTPGKPEVVLSPLTYIYEEDVELEVAVQLPTGREAALDAILAAIGARLAIDRTFGGLCDDVRARAPVFRDEPVTGAPSIRACTLNVCVIYGTPDPLS